MLPCIYIIVGNEIGENNTPHLQIYAEFANGVTFKRVRAWFTRPPHIEARMGTRDQARAYSMKENNYIERGEWRIQGERNDLDAVRQQALDGGLQAVTRTRNAQQIRVAEKFLEYNEEERDWAPEVIWIWGAPGIGKSRQAAEIAGDRHTYHKDTTKWWSKYDAHEVVIINEFRDSMWELRFMLQLLDRYPFRVEYKGGFREMLARTIIITSVKPPESHYVGIQEDPHQLQRRITQIIHLE